MTIASNLKRTEDDWVKYLELFPQRQLKARFEFTEELASAACARMSNRLGIPLIFMPVDIEERMVIFESAVPNQFLRNPDNPYVGILFSMYYPLVCIAFDWDLDDMAAEVCSTSLRELSFCQVPFSVFASPDEYDGTKLSKLRDAVANRLPNPFPQLRLTMKRRQLWGEIFDYP